MLSKFMSLFRAAQVARPRSVFAEALEPRQLLATVPAGFADARITSGISRGTAMALAPDGRLFVAEQTGKLRVIKDHKLLSNAFVTVSTPTDGSEGLIGVAIDPQFSSNKYIYVAYTKSGPLRTVVSRFTANGDVYKSGSEKVLFTSPELENHEHNGGALSFGEDGKLYIALGDDLTITNAQSKNTTQGKILRINKDGTIPGDNPFYNSASGKNRAIWAYGFRNPFTISFQPGTGRLLSGDVGTAFWEEINDVKKGGNYGWSNSEGPTNRPGEISPIFSYKHNEFGECVIVGSFYNPKNVMFPSSYVGKVFISDYVRGWIKTLDLSGSTPKTANFISGLDRCISMVTAPDGSLYYLLRGGFGTGEVHRVTYGASGAPVIGQQPQSQSAVLGQPVTFSVSASGANPLKYQWRRNGKNISGATSASYTINKVSASDNGAQFDCVISNSKGSKTSSKAKLIVIQDTPPVAEITAPAASLRYHGGMTISFAGTATDLEDGTLAASRFSWEALLHHDTHTHPFWEQEGVKGGTFTIPAVEETSDNVWYELILTVTDSHGVRSSVSHDILPKKVQFNVQSNVAGLNVALDSVTTNEPIGVTGVVGIRRQLSAPLVQVLNGRVYEFVSWSDGGDATHYILTPNDRTSYIANYAEIRTVPIGNGLNAAYYDNANFTGTKKSRTDKQINFIWSKDPPISGIGADSFSVRWTGYIVAPTSETYTFFANIDDGAKLWVNNKVIIDKFGSTGAKEHSGKIALEAGKKYPIKLEYKDVSGYAQAQLSWQTAKLPREIIPQGALFTSESSGQTQSPPPASPPPASGSAKVLNTVADTYVRGGSNASKNFGADSTLAVKNDSDAGYTRETYLKFDLSGISSITSAVLEIAGTINTKGSLEIGVYGASGSPVWDESNLKWSNKPSVSGSAIAKFTVNSTSSKTYSADLSTYLRNELKAGRKSVTFVLKGTSKSTLAAIFNARESQWGGPKLRIT